MSSERVICPECGRLGYECGKHLRERLDLMQALGEERYAR